MRPELLTDALALVAEDGAVLVLDPLVPPAPGAGLGGSVAEAHIRVGVVELAVVQPTAVAAALLRAEQVLGKRER